MLRVFERLPDCTLLWPGTSPLRTCAAPPNISGEAERPAHRVYVRRPRTGKRRWRWMRASICGIRRPGDVRHLGRVYGRRQAGDHDGRSRELEVSEGTCHPDQLGRERGCRTRGDRLLGDGSSCRPCMRSGPCVGLHSRVALDRESGQFVRSGSPLTLNSMRWLAVVAAGSAVVSRRPPRLSRVRCVRVRLSTNVYLPRAAAGTPLLVRPLWQRDESHHGVQGVHRQLLRRRCSGRAGPVRQRRDVPASDS